MSGVVSDDNPAANAAAAWKGMEDGWSRKSSAPLTLRYVAVMILGLVFEGARRRRALERNIEAQGRRIEAQDRRIEELEQQLAATLGADAR